MDSNGENSDAKYSEDQTPLAIITLPPATASLSLSLSSIRPIHILLPPKISSLLSHRPNKVKIPTEASSVSNLYLSSSLSPPKPIFKSTITSSTFQSAGRTSDASNASGIHRATIVWFRNNLRVHDNECLNSANYDSVSVLPVYCFDPRDFGAYSPGLKITPERAFFLIDAVMDLRKNLQARGSDLVVKIGNPETVLAEIARTIGADAVYTHREVSYNEVTIEKKIEASLNDEGVKLKYFWSSTLYHVEDLPFKMENMPTNFYGFEEKVQAVEVRKTIAPLEQLRGLPPRGDLETGDIPSLKDLFQDEERAGNASMVGGESEALKRLQKFAAECQAQPPKVSICANFCREISPWLATGCLSPRSIFDAAKTFSGASNLEEGGTRIRPRMTLLMSELIWSDFFRFSDEKCRSALIPAKLHT